MTESVLCRLAAIAILVAGGVHLDLWLTHGYRGVHVIGPLFLLNTISAIVFAALLVLWRGALVELAGVGYAATTLAAFFVSVYHGLFGFVEVLDGTPQLVAALAEVTAIALLVTASAFSRNRGQFGRSHHHLDERRARGA